MRPLYLQPQLPQVEQPAQISDILSAMVFRFQVLNVVREQTTARILGHIILSASLVLLQVATPLLQEHLQQQLQLQHLVEPVQMRPGHNVAEVSTPDKLAAQVDTIAGSETRTILNVFQELVSHDVSTKITLIFIKSRKYR
jgi:hypothetical protein